MTLKTYAQIDASLNQLSYPHSLVANLLFGCGLRVIHAIRSIQKLMGTRAAKQL